MDFYLKWTMIWMDFYKKWIMIWMDCAGVLLRQIWAKEKQGKEATLGAIMLFVALLLISAII